MNIKRTIAIAISTALLGVGGTVVLKQNATQEQVNSQVITILDSLKHEGLIILTPPDDSIDVLKKYTDKITELDTVIYKTRDSLGHIIGRDTVIVPPHWIIKNADPSSLKLNGLAYVCPMGSKLLLTVSIDGEMKDMLRIKPILDSATVNVETIVSQH
jgi:hypothetical protein